MADARRAAVVVFLLAFGQAVGVRAAEPAKSDAKAQAPKVEAPKAEAPKAEAPKAGAPKSEAPKGEASKGEASKAEASKGKPDPQASAEKKAAGTAAADGKADGKKDTEKKSAEPKAPARVGEADAAEKSKLSAQAPKGAVVPRGSVGPEGVVKLVPGKGMDPKKMAKLRVNRPGSSAAALSPNGLRDEIKHNVSFASVSSGQEPLSRSRAEKLLEQMSKTREALEKDTARLEAMHKEATQSADALAALQSQLEAAKEDAKKSPGVADPKTQKNPLDVVAKELRGIKATEAGPIVVRLDRKLAANILKRMPPADAGKILGAIKPDIAAEIAAEIAEGEPKLPAVASKLPHQVAKP